MFVFSPTRRSNGSQRLFFLLMLLGPFPGFPLRRGGIYLLFIYLQLILYYLEWKIRKTKHLWMAFSSPILLTTFLLSILPFLNFDSNTNWYYVQVFCFRVAIYFFLCCVLNQTNRKAKFFFLSFLLFHSAAVVVRWGNFPSTCYSFFAAAIIPSDSTLFYTLLGHVWYEPLLFAVASVLNWKFTA